VLAPNVRGSTGYGREYQELIHRDWGGGDLRDFEAAAQYLQRLDWVDPDRVGVFGGFYGGFATLSCLSRLPQYWACGSPGSGSVTWSPSSAPVPRPGMRWS
jgi:dipeptidyl aminopeptidase/acylaminoacyl peptidase